MLSSAITFDLLITTPILYYLIIRKRSIPKTTIIPVFILGIIVASIILPQAHQGYLELVKTWFLPLLELGVFTYLVVMIELSLTIEHYSLSRLAIEFDKTEFAIILPSNWRKWPTSLKVPTALP